MNKILMPRLNDRFSVKFERSDTSEQIAERVSLQLISIKLPIISSATPLPDNADTFTLRTDTYSVYVEVEDDSFGSVTKTIYKDLLRNRFKVVVSYLTGQGEVAETMTFKSCSVTMIELPTLTYFSPQPSRHQIQTPDYLVGEQPELQRALKGVEVVKLTANRPSIKNLKITFADSVHWFNPKMEQLIKEEQ